MPYAHYGPYINYIQTPYTPYTLRTLHALHERCPKSWSFCFASKKMLPAFGSLCFPSFGLRHDFIPHPRCGVVSYFCLNSSPITHIHPRVCQQRPWSAQTQSVPGVPNLRVSLENPWSAQPQSIATPPQCMPSVPGPQKIPRVSLECPTCPQRIPRASLGAPNPKVNNRFRRLGQQELLTLPHGTQHFCLRQTFFQKAPILSKDAPGQATCIPVLDAADVRGLA